MNAKILIALILFAAFAAGGIVVMRKMGWIGSSPVKAKGARSTDAPDDEGLSMQKWQPVADVRGTAVIQKDGTAICYVKVACKNNSLLNRSEQADEAAALAPALASQQSPFKIMHIQRPVDSSANLARLEARDAEYERRIVQMGSADGLGRLEAMERRQLDVRRRVLGHYRRHAEAELRTSGRMTSEGYICLPAPYSTGNEEVAYQQARDMRDRLKAAGYTSRILWGEEALALGLAYQGSHRTKFENTGPDALSPLVRGLNDMAATDGEEA